MEQAKTGALIASKRRELNMTQAELAKKLGVTNKAVSRWETGAGFPDVSLLEPLADALGLSVLELLRGVRVEDACISLAEADSSVRQALGEAESLSRAKRIENTVLIVIILVGCVLSLVSCVSVGARDEWTMGQEHIGGEVLYGMKYGWDSYAYIVYDEDTEKLSLAYVDIEQKFLWRFKRVSDMLIVDLGASGEDWVYQVDEADEHFYTNKNLSGDTCSCHYVRYPPLRTIYDNDHEHLYIGVTRDPGVLEGKTVHYSREIDGYLVFAYTELREDLYG